MSRDYTTEEIKAISRVAFRSEWRLPMLLAIKDSPDGRVTLSSLGRTLGCDDSSLSKGFHTLVELGALVPRLEEGQRKKFHEVVKKTAIWAWAEELAARVTVDED